MASKPVRPDAPLTQARLRLHRHPADKPRVGPNPSGLCLCGCGLKAPLARQNSAERGWVKDQPIKYIAGHNGLCAPVTPERLREAAQDIARREAKRAERAVQVAAVATVSPRPLEEKARMLPPRSAPVAAAPKPEPYRHPLATGRKQVITYVPDKLESERAPGVSIFSRRSESPYHGWGTRRRTSFRP